MSSNMLCLCALTAGSDEMHIFSFTDEAAHKKIRKILAWVNIIFFPISSLFFLLLLIFHVTQNAYEFSADFISIHIDMGQ